MKTNRFTVRGMWRIPLYLAAVAMALGVAPLQAAQCPPNIFPGVNPASLVDPQAGLMNLYSFNNPILDATKLQKYVTPVPNALAPGFIYTPNGTQGGETLYTVSMREITQSLGVVYNNPADTANNGCTAPPNTLWAYGDARDNGVTAAPTAPHSVPGPTYELMSNVPHRVLYTNELPNTNPRHHPANIDPTLDCGPNAPGCAPFNRVVPHTHGAHVADDSDGNPDQWFTPGFAITGHNWQPNTHIPGAVTGTYRFDNTQEAGTIWYHDHAMGLTHLNVFAGLAGFNIIRDANEIAMQTPPTAGGPAVLPKYPFENLMAIQDRVFDVNGQQYSPDRPIQDQNATLTNVACDPALPTTVSATNPVVSPYACAPANLQGGTGNLLLNTTPCDVAAPIVGPTPSPYACPVKYFTLNADGSFTVIPTGTTPPAGAVTFPSITPEYWGNVILVNGQVWPKQDVEKRVYRFRWLNGSDSRTYVLRLVDGTTKLPITGLDIWQIGTEQGFLNTPVKTMISDPTAVNPVAPFPQTNGIVIMPGERVDVLIDFKNVPAGTTQVILQNLGPDAPYTGEYPPSMANGQTPTVIVPEIMLFNVIPTLSATPDTMTPSAITSLRTPVAALTPTAGTPVRNLYLAERVDQFGRLALTINGVDYMSAINDFVKLGDVEEWDVYNLTPDGHPMHPHLVAFQVIDRQDLIDPATALPFAPPMNPPLLNTPVSTQFNGVAPNPAMPTATGAIYPPDPNETNAWKDTIIAPPGKVTRIKARFDIPGLYVFHCHILSHEENDMMRSFGVTTPAASVTLSATPATQLSGTAGTVTLSAAAKTAIAAYPDSNAFEYQFTVTPPGGTPTALMSTAMVNPTTTAGYTMVRTATWMPPMMPGTYALTVTAKPMGQAPTATNTVTSTINYVIAAAGISGVTSTTAAGAFNAGNTINLTMAFNQVITSAAGLSVALNSGATLTTGPITTPTSSIALSYLVAPTNNTPAGQFLDITGITGSVTDGAGNAISTLTIPAGANLSANKQISIDNTLPSVTLTSPAATVSTLNQTVAGTATDPVGIKSVTVNGTACTLGTGGSFSTPVTLVSGANTITVVATDMAGNQTTATQTVTVDTALPMTSITPPPGTYTGSVNVTLTANKPATIYYTIDGTTPTTASMVYAQPIVLSATTTTTITLKYFAVDQAGNQEAVKSAAYTLHTADLTAKVAINSGADYTKTANVTLSMSASDKFGVASYAISVDNGATYQPTVTLSPAPTSFSKKLAITLPTGDGLKGVYVKFTDSLGVVYPPIIDTITLDTVPPVTTASPDTSATYPGGTMKIALAANEKATIYYTTNGTTPTKSSSIFSSPFNITGTNSTVTVKYFAIDKAGNQETVKTSTYTFGHAADLTASITINNGARYTNSRNVSLAFSASDPVSGGVNTMSFSNDGTTYSTPVPYAAASAMPWTLSAGNGLKVVYVRFTDNATPANTYTFTDRIYLAEGVKLTTGDLNGDGKVDISDCLLAMKTSTGVVAATVEEMARGDVGPLVSNKPQPDGIIDSGDVLVITKKGRKA